MMRRIRRNAHLPLLPAILFLLLACGLLPEPPPAPVTPTAAAPAPTASATAPPATPPALQATASATAARDDATSEPQPPTSAGPSLFDVAWQDRALFEAGLLNPADASLPALRGASVYHMDLVLSSDLLTLSGIEEIYYTNQEDVALNELYLRLFPNLTSGRTEISGVWLDGQPIEPSFELEDSAMRLPLPQPLPPEAARVVRVAFEVTIPTEGGGNYGTFAYSRDILALAHFYPMIAVYDEEGWNLEIAPPGGDVVYADIAFYLVRLNAPAGLVIAAGGVEVQGGSDGERQELLFAAGPARDFYMAASPGFTVTSEQVDGTLVNSYAFAQLEPAARQALAWTAAALRTLNEQIGAYPYGELDVVATPTLALGVEYPGIVVINIDLLDPLARPSAPLLLHSTVAHEVAHQWFYAVVGNDQVDEPWLDESLAQYVTYLYLRQAGEPGDAEAFYRSLEQRWQSVNLADIPIGQPVAAYQGAEYSAIVYGRGPLFFEALHETMGQQAFDAFLRAYYERLKWDIATAERLQALAEESCGCELAGLFAEWVYGQ